MSRRRIRDRLLLGAALALALLAPAAGRADFLATLSESTTSVGGGLYQYTYTLADLASSTVAATDLYIQVGPGANLSAITNSAGWDVDYTPGNSTISFDSSDPSLDLQPGSLATFSFESFVGPGAAFSDIRSVDTFPTSDIGGMTVAPDVATVPVPPSALLLALGGLGGLGARFLRKKPA